MGPTLANASRTSDARPTASALTATGQREPDHAAIDSGVSAMTADGESVTKRLPPAPAYFSRLMTSGGQQ